MDPHQPESWEQLLEKAESWTEQNGKAFPLGLVICQMNISSHAVLLLPFETVFNTGSEF